nr:transposase [Mesorhizobium loti]
MVQQVLALNPHIQCLVPGSALSPDGRWLSCRPRFFLPIYFGGCSSNG